VNISRHIALLIMIKTQIVIVIIIIYVKSLIIFIIIEKKFILYIKIAQNIKMSVKRKKCRPIFYVYTILIVTSANVSDSN